MMYKARIKNSLNRVIPRNDGTHISRFFIILNHFRNIGGGDKFYRHPV